MTHNLAGCKACWNREGHNGEPFLYPPTEAPREGLYLSHVTCRACGAHGAGALTADRAAMRWNERQMRILVIRPLSRVYKVVLQ